MGGRAKGGVNTLPRSKMTQQREEVKQKRELGLSLVTGGGQESRAKLRAPGVKDQHPVYGHACHHHSQNDAWDSGWRLLLTSTLTLEESAFFQLTSLLKMSPVSSFPTRRKPNRGLCLSTLVQATERDELPQYPYLKDQRTPVPSAEAFRWFF
ncbi:uncharacterized protein [Struthio camelus]|uniref:uncharacterized protein isoform X3 n=1 Tax=Struthio camelus TaxID=8801 RepID=UPI003603E15C